MLDRQFQPTEPNRCWAGDITYIRTTDLFSRHVVGWKLGSTLEASLIIEALERAMGQREVKPEQLLIHMDRGSQYTAADYQKMLKAKKINCSMSGKGHCWDNAVSESFFSASKLELELDENSDRLLTPWEFQRESAF